MVTAKPSKQKMVTEKPSKQKWRAGRFVLLGMVALLVLLGGVALWSATTKIAGAIITSGQIEVKSNRQVVQHLQGGVVREILVTDGDIVEAGQVLLRFDAVLTESELAITEGQLFELLGQKSRLLAERDGAEDITFEPELVDVAKSRPKVAELIEGQGSLFFARRDSLNETLAQWNERGGQINNQIEGAQAQLASLKEQASLLAQELADQETLLESGLTQASRVSALRREVASFAGRIGALDAEIAGFRARLAEIEIERLKLSTSLREEAISALRELQPREIELRQNRLSLLEVVNRLALRAPRSGVVFGLSVFTPRAVVQAGAPILYIIPQDEPLIIRTRIPTQHIDQIRVGQPAALRFSTFEQNTPDVMAKVVNISPDVFTDDRTGASYYSAELRPDPGELEKLEGVEILPGMPVEAFIKTEDRTPLEYLIKPLTIYFSRAFREG
ncbi:MAG: HlyD family type I secretion periplasmic adaptor subunit [Rhodobacteraceae bacterium]|nr:HlyD family type I secretion periplasmic adaptor subunit [Paracoccaceae bacterium]